MKDRCQKVTKYTYVDDGVNHSNRTADKVLGCQLKGTADCRGWSRNIVKREFISKEPSSTLN